jgi:hypothetical protein
MKPLTILAVAGVVMALGFGAAAAQGPEARGDRRELREDLRDRRDDRRDLQQDRRELRRDVRQGQ